jgi:hypothetical protein
MIRTARVIGIALAASIALAGLAGCARLGNSAQDNSTDLGWDAQALESMGYATADLTSADAAATASPTRAPGQRGRHPRLRFAFRHMLHGEATVQTDEGTKVVDVQRGTVTAETDTALTVRSSDGFTLTWQLNAQTVVVVNRAKSTIGNVKVGSEVGVAGARDGDTVTARLVVVPRTS